MKNSAKSGVNPTWRSCHDAPCYSQTITMKRQHLGACLHDGVVLVQVSLVHGQPVSLVAVVAAAAALFLHHRRSLRRQEPHQLLRSPPGAVERIEGVLFEPPWRDQTTGRTSQ